jgi:hypothetical protein
MKKLIVIALMILFSCSFVSGATAQDLTKNNVIIQFNGAGENNQLYIGQKNRLEILVVNAVELGGISLGLEFKCENCGYRIDTGYGDIASTKGEDLMVLKAHEEAFDGKVPWWSVIAYQPGSDSVGIGGLHMPTDYRLPPHATPVLLYSMQIEIPADTRPQKEGFCVDNIFYPPAGKWIFSNSKGISVVPAFMGQHGGEKADPVCFDIVMPE